MKKDLGVFGLIATSLLLTVFAFVLLFTSPYGILQLFILLVSLILGVIALVRSIKEKSNSKIIFSIIVAVLPVLVFLWVQSISNERARQVEEETERTLDYYRTTFPINTTN